MGEIIILYIYLLFIYIIYYIIITSQEKFFTKILKSKKYKRILLVGSGSLHTPVLVNQHQTVPAISHAVKIEVLS